MIQGRIPRQAILGSVESRVSWAFRLEAMDPICLNIIALL